MSTIDMTVLSNGLQALVDSRLDTIDRMLMGRVSRRERLDIVRDVETQIHELLAQQVPSDAEPTRDDLLSVLARLDPPEAYLSETDEETTSTEGSHQPLMAQSRPLPLASRSSVQPTSQANRRGFQSGMVAMATLTSFLLFPIGYALGLLFQSEIVIGVVWFLALVILLSGGAVAVTLATMSRLSNKWAVVGLTIGILSILMSIGGALTLIMLIIAANS